MGNDEGGRRGARVGVGERGKWNDGSQSKIHHIHHSGFGEGTGDSARGCGPSTALYLQLTSQKPTVTAPEPGRAASGWDSGRLAPLSTVQPTSPPDEGAEGASRALGAQGGDHGGTRRHFTSGAMGLTTTTRTTGGPRRPMAATDNGPSQRARTTSSASGLAGRPREI